MAHVPPNSPNNSTTTARRLNPSAVSDRPLPERLAKFHSPPEPRARVPPLPDLPEVRKPLTSEELSAHLGAARSALVEWCSPLRLNPEIRAANRHFAEPEKLVLEVAAAHGPSTQASMR